MRNNDYVVDDVGMDNEGWGADREANKADANDKAVRYANVLTFEDVTVWEARRELHEALAASLEIEQGAESQGFREAKLQEV